MKVFFPLALVAIVLVIYSSALNGTFLYDDEFLIQKNIIVQNFKLLPQAFVTSTTEGAGGQDSFYRPLQIVFYSLVYQLFGDAHFWFHLLNIMIHGLNAVLVYRLIDHLFKQPQLSFITALLWAVHPIHTEAVAYISATADPLHFFFGLLFLWTGLKRRLFLSLLFFTAALLTKEASVTFPALLFAAHLSLSLLKKDRLAVSAKSALLASAPSLALAVVYILLRKTLLDFDDSFAFYSEENIYTSSVLNRLFTASAAITKYFELLIWPGHLQIDRAFPVYTSFFRFPVALGLLITLISLIPVFRINKIHPLLLFFSLWFWGYHSLHTGILLPLNSLFLEHWMYIPSVAFVGAAIHLLFQRVQNPKVKKAAILLCLALALALSVRTYRQNFVWLNPISLYTHILKGSPGIARAHNNLAMALSDQGRLEEAERHYLKSIEIDDSYPQVRHNLGLLYLRRNQIDAGISQLKRALEIHPGFFHSHLYLSRAYAFKGERELAEEHLKKFNELAPKFKPPGMEP